MMPIDTPTWQVVTLFLSVAVLGSIVGLFTGMLLAMYILDRDVQQIERRMRRNLD